MKKLKILLIILLLCGITSGQQKPMLGTQINWANSKGLVGYWAFHEGSGNKVYDLSGNGNHGTHDDPPAWWIGGPHGSAMYFDGGANHRISVPDSPSLQVFSQFTVVVYFKTDCDVEKDGSNFYLAKSAATALTFRHNQLTDTGTTFTVGTIDDGDWHLAIACWDGVKTYLGYDGVIFSGDAATGTMDLSGDVLWLGESVYGKMTGNLSFVAIYNRAFTYNEIVRFTINPFAMFERDYTSLWQAGLTNGNGSYIPSFMHHIKVHRR